MPGPVAYFDIRGRPHSANGKFTKMPVITNFEAPRRTDVVYQRRRRKAPGEPRQRRRDAGTRRGPRGVSLSDQINMLRQNGISKQQIRNYYLGSQGGKGPIGDMVGLIPGPIGMIGKTLGGLFGLGVPPPRRRNMRGGSIQTIARTALGSLAELNPTANTIYNLGQKYRPATGLSNLISNSRYGNTTAGRIGNKILSPLRWLGFGPPPRRKRRQNGGSLKQIARSTLASLAGLNSKTNRAYELGVQYRPATQARNYIRGTKYANTNIGRAALTALKPLKWLGFGPVKQPRRQVRHIKL